MTHHGLDYANQDRESRNPNIVAASRALWKAKSEIYEAAHQMREAELSEIAARADELFKLVERLWLDTKHRRFSAADRQAILMKSPGCIRPTSEVKDTHTEEEGS